MAKTASPKKADEPAQAPAEQQESDLSVQHPVGTVLWVKPGRLIIGKNVRQRPKLKRDFLDSIRERGIGHSIRIYYGDALQLIVDDGQKRTLAAHELGLTLVKVEVIAEPVEEDRIIDQLHLNRYRDDVTAADEVAAYQQLALLGMTTDQIAKKAVVDKKDVEAALKLANSERAKAAAAEVPEMTIGQLTVLAEFEDDDKAIATLTKAAASDQFEHKAQQMRDSKNEAACKKKLLDQLAKEGVTVIPAPFNDKNIAEVSALRDRTGTRINLKEHAKCPGHSAYLTRNYGSKREPLEIVYACRDLKAYSHYTNNDTKLRTKDMTPEQAAAASAERKDVVASNKAWTSAETVRRKWLTEFFARKTAPKGTAKFLAETALRADYQVTNDLSKGLDLAAELLGVAQAHTSANRNPRFGSLIDNTTEARTQMITLACYLAAYEAGMTKDSWRRVENSKARYLRFLADHGYPLSPVERRAAGLEALPEAQAPADDADDPDDGIDAGLDEDDHEDGFASEAGPEDNIDEQ